MKLRFACPACQRPQQVDLDVDLEQVRCRDCGWSQPNRWTKAVGGPPGECNICGCHDLWRQTDFPPKLGLALVALGAVLSTWAWAVHRPIVALGVLLGFALLDFACYLLMPDVFVCYRCHARYGPPATRTRSPTFNLETAERYRQEAARIARARKASDVEVRGS